MRLLGWLHITFCCHGKKCIHLLRMNFLLVTDINLCEIVQILITIVVMFAILLFLPIV